MKKFIEYEKKRFKALTDVSILVYKKTTYPDFLKHTEGMRLTEQDIIDKFTNETHCYDRETYVLIDATSLHDANISDNIKILAIKGHDEKHINKARIEEDRNNILFILEGDIAENNAFAKFQMDNCGTVHELFSVHTNNHSYLVLWYDYSGDLSLCGVTCSDCNFDPSEYKDYKFSLDKDEYIVEVEVDESSSG